MTAAEQNRAIAEWMGWTKIHTGYPMDGIKPGSVAALRHLIPNFHGDLNAIHEAEDKLCQEDQVAFVVKLLVRSKPKENNMTLNWYLIHATAPQRCEALLRTLGLWKEDK